MVVPSGLESRQVAPPSGAGSRGYEWGSEDGPFVTRNPSRLHALDCHSNVNGRLLRSRFFTNAMQSQLSISVNTAHVSKRSDSQAAHQATCPHACSTARSSCRGAGIRRRLASSRRRSFAEFRVAIDRPIWNLEITRPEVSESVDRHHELGKGAGQRVGVIRRRQPPRLHVLLRL